MSTDKKAQQRRARKLEKQKKKRADASRPARSSAPAALAADPRQGRGWPAGECWISQDWDTPGATVHAVLSRSHEDGRTVAASFTLDRSGPGLRVARARGGLRPEHVAGESARLSEEHGATMIETSAALVASLVVDARRHGTLADPPGAADALALLDDLPIEPVDPPFGPATHAEDPPKEGGLLSRLARRWLG